MRPSDQTNNQHDGLGFRIYKSTQQLFYFQLQSMRSYWHFAELTEVKTLNFDLEVQLEVAKVELVEVAQICKRPALPTSSLPDQSATSVQFYLSPLAKSLAKMYVSQDTDNNAI